jgi:GNAT superfamily N-acetyltransferase
MSFTIRRAGAGDEAIILAFIKKLAQYEKLSHEVTATETDIRDSFCSSSPRVFAEIGEWNNTPVAFAVWFYNYSTFHGRHGIYLEDLFVDPEHRGKGLGKSMLKHLAGICMAEGLTRFQWWVLNWNKPAINVYKSLGAEPMDEWTVYRLSGEALQRLARR